MHRLLRAADGALRNQFYYQVSINNGTTEHPRAPALFARYTPYAQATVRFSLSPLLYDYPKMEMVEVFCIAAFS